MVRPMTPRTLQALKYSSRMGAYGLAVAAVVLLFVVGFMKRLFTSDGSKPEFT